VLKPPQVGSVSNQPTLALVGELGGLGSPANVFIHHQPHRTSSYLPSGKKKTPPTTNNRHGTLKKKRRRRKKEPLPLNEKIENTYAI